MKMKKNAFFDFFQKIFANRKFQMTFSAAACAFVLSFSLVGLSKIGMPTSSLLASVTHLETTSWEKIEFDADIALIMDSQFSLVAGKNMEAVDVVEGIILSNPSDTLVLLAGNNSVQIFQESEGMHRFRVELLGKDILQGEKIAEFEGNVTVKSPVTLLDTQFVSEGIRYNLSNTVK